MATPNSTPSPLRAYLASNVRYARSLMAVAQDHLSGVAGMGRHVVGAIEREQHSASLETLSGLALALGIPADVLIKPPVEAHALILKRMMDAPKPPVARRVRKKRVSKPTSAA